MKVTRKLTTVLLALVMILSTLPIFGTADESYLEQFCISVAVGADESQLNFSWYYPTDVDGSLTYAKSADLIDGEMPEDAVTIEVEGLLANDLDEYAYHVVITDLDPATEYVYQLANGDDIGDIKKVCTGEEGDFSFLFLGDPQTDNGGELWANSIEIMTAHPELEDASFWISGGDQVDSGFDEYNFVAYLDHEPLYTIPVATTIGNHDNQGTFYPFHFNVANMSDKYGVTNAGGDSYFTFNNALFISINSNCDDPDQHRAFIAETVEANPDARWRIVVQHHSMFSPTERTDDEYSLSLREKLVPIYEEFDIDVVLNGHDHAFGRTYLMNGDEPITDPAAYDDESMASATDPEGIIYLTANSSSGTKMYDTDTRAEEYCAAMLQDNSPHATKVYVSDSELTLATYSLNEMDLVDSFTINKTPEMSFTDVPEGQWYTEGIRYCFKKGYMAGVSENEFGRKQNVNRAMFATILAKIDGADTSSYTEMSFTDVPAGQWYSNAIEWAYRNEYAAGIGNGQFGRKNDVSREQIALFFHTYSSLNGIDVTAKADLSVYSDLDRVHDWALDAVEWAVAESLISGTSETTLSPRASASRAEIALIIKNYVESIKKGGNTSSPKPVLSFAAMSDVHIGDTNTEESMRRTLGYLTDTFGELDAFMFSGDLTNTTGSTLDPSQVERFKEIYNEEITYDPLMIYSLGPTHDVPYASAAEPYRALYRDVLGDEFFTYDVGSEEMALDGVRHAVISGYHFFSIDFEGDSAGFNSEAWEWLKNEIAAAAAEDPEKPFFVSTHVPDLPTVTVLLSEYPQAVCFTGHLHNSAAREDSIRQDFGFTNVHCGGMNYYRVDGYNRFNDNPFLKLGNIYDFAQAIYVELYDDNTVRLQRVDCYNGVSFGETWELTPDNFGKYTDSRRQEELCSFNEESKLEILELNGEYLQVSFDRAEAGAAGPALYYSIEVLTPTASGYAVTASADLGSQQVFFPNDENIPDLYYTYTFEGIDLSDYALVITAHDCWGKSVNALVYNGGNYIHNTATTGDINVTKRDFTEQEQLTGPVTEGAQDIEFPYGSGTNPTSFDDDVDYSMAVRFHPTLEFTDVEFRCSSWGDQKGTLDFTLYEWQGDYDSTLEGTPVDTYSLVDFAGSTVYNVFDGNYAPGDYLIVITSPTPEEGVGLYYYPMQNGDENAYESYDCGIKMVYHIYFSWTNTMTAIKPYVPIK